MTVALLVAALPASVGAAPPPRGTRWTEHYFPSSDGITMLHADVLRPAGLSDDAKTPVILTVSPYTNHSGATSDYSPNETGPSSRFYDFLELSRIIERGYTYVIVDLPGFGGSGGCNDWGGEREQGATKAAVEWAASQPWSTGRVGMMGKSYDAWTGLMAMAQEPEGLAAVVSMEPVYSGYRYLYDDGVRFINSLITPAGFQAYDAKPGSLRDDPFYNVNGAPQAWCYGLNYSLQQQDDPESPFWTERDLLRTTKDSKVPLFLTQGFLEKNTKPDGAFDFYSALDGPNRAWFGQFDHYRGWEQDGSGRYQMGRSVFIREMLRFFDRHVKGARPVRRDAPVAVQDNFGRYRAETQWPPRDSRMWWSALNKGTYEDNGANRAVGSAAGRGVWTFSQSLPHDVWLAGEAVVKVDLDAVPRANVVANIYDVDRTGTATLVSRGTALTRGAGAQKMRLELYGQDWVLQRGHRIGVLLSGSNSDWWLHVPTRTSVNLAGATIGLPLLTFDRERFLDGGSTPRLEDHLETAVTTVEDRKIREAQRTFKLPSRLH